MPPANKRPSSGHNYPDSETFEIEYGADVAAAQNGKSNGRPSSFASNKNKQGNGNGNNDKMYTGPIDLDEMFDDDDSMADNDLFADDDDQNQAMSLLEEAISGPRFFNNPNKRLLDNDASLIPGSPFSKPATTPSNRPSEPLSIAKYASTLALCITLGWVGYLLFAAVWNYSSIGRIVVEAILALLSFFGLFWNSYFIVSSILKCFIPKKAFTTNTKYCSIIPETAPREAEWLDVTIQIPVYKESLKEVLMPTLKSCMKSRDYYHDNVPGGKARCNIVVCDDGMMAMLRDNFAAAEMLWESIVDTQGRVIKLSQLLKLVSRASRRHLKGLRSKNVYEVFHRMIFYYHFGIGFVARSTVDRRGKFKKASNLNSHLRLALGAAQMAAEDDELTFQDALMQESHNDDGSRYVMFGNNIRLGHLIVINDADARMSEQVIVVRKLDILLANRAVTFLQMAPFWGG